jgi:hypothetical protein
LQGEQWMGLAQTITFDCQNASDIEDFIAQLESSVELRKSSKGWLVTHFERDSFNFEIIVKGNALYTHRSGNYFAFLGFLIEQLTGKFDKVVIEDV